MKKKTKDILRIVCGIFLIILGIIGGFLPVMPGFVFTFMGLSMISVNFAKDLQKIQRRFRFHGKLSKMLMEIYQSLKTIIKNSLRKKERNRI